MNSVNSANDRKINPVWTSRNATNAKISTGAVSATRNCGRYCPKNVSRLSTPSTSDIRMSPVRRWSTKPGPSASTCS